MMKKISILIFIALLSIGSIAAQAEYIPNLDQLSTSVITNDPSIPTQNKAAGDCNIGNESDAGFTLLTGNFSANFISGLKYTLPTEGTLNAIGIVTQTTGIAQVRMAVYDDLNGAPNNLVSQSGTADVIIGTVTLPVTPTVLPAGDYWIMVSFDEDGQHSKRKLLAGNIGYYGALNFGDPAPSNASLFISTLPNTDNLYFLDIDCGVTTGLNDFDEDILSIYPNPTAEKITIESNESILIEDAQLIDATGRMVKSFPINQSTNSKTIDLSDILAGMYFLKLTSDNQVIVKSVIIK